MVDKSEESFAAELQSIFLTETHEMLDDTEAAFMQIEENPDDDAKIDKIFRLVHTIKGSAHVAGFTQLGNFSHSFETLLAAIREKKLKVEPNIVDILLAGNDCIRLFVDTLRQDPSSQLDVAAIESKIRSAYTVTGAEKPNPPPQPAKVESHSKVPASNIQPLPLGNADNSSSLVRADKRNILICDDDEDILEILADLVESGGHRVVRVMNGLEALKATRSESFDVIVSDLKMPEMDGEEFVREVRKFNHLIPIIIISGFSSRDNLKTFVQLGVDEFIDKPFNDEMVLRSIARAIKVRTLRESILGLSRLSFKAYISFQKLESLTQYSASPEELKAEKSHLDHCLDEMKVMTGQLLESERAIKTDKAS